MVVLTMGVLLPTIEQSGFDLLWFGIFVVLVVEMAQITPPVGFNLFVLQGMTKKDIVWIAKQAFPLFVLMIVMVLLMYYVPGITSWLPEHMQG
jgi:TRAP-type C4-dicarboxylate transport system permease large subunit